MKKREAPSRRQRWQPYVRDIAERMAMRDWAIHIWEDLPGGAPQLRADASCEPIYGRKVAVLRFAEAFLDGSPESQRHCVVHELLHCHMAPFTRALEVKGFTDPMLTMVMEYAVDGIADAIAPFMPLPPAYTQVP